jgi:hypothetical protein
MIRALTTLLGLAGAAAILYLVTDVGTSGGSWWSRALLWAAAGLAVGIFYQAGGRRAPGVRMNLPLLILAFLPWTLLTAALVAVEANKPVWLADRGRDILPDAWILRWEVSLPAFAFLVGMLLAFSLLEPRIGIREVAPALESATAPVETYTPYSPPEPAPDPAYTPVTAVQPAVRPAPETTVAETTTPASDSAETVVTDPGTIDAAQARQIADGTANDPANPVQVVHPRREGDSGG